MVLALKEINRYTGTDLTRETYNIIYKYKIKKKLNYFIINNTPNNNTIINTLAILWRGHLILMVGYYVIGCDSAKPTLV